jgi:predicted HicB family RNase H-like nuclease
MIEYKGYTGVFEFDPELGLFAGHVVDLRDEIYFEGDSVTALKDSMQRAVDHYLEVCDVRGDEPEKPFSGKLNVRLGSELHRSVAVAAAASGESINSWIQRVVEVDRRRKQGSKSRSTPRKPRARAKKQSA